MKLVIKTLCLISAIAMSLGFLPGFQISAKAESKDEDDFIIKNSSGAFMTYVTYDSLVTIEFIYVETSPITQKDGEKYTASNNDFSLNGIWSKKNAKLTVEVLEPNKDNASYQNMRVTLENVIYKSSTQKNALSITNVNVKDASGNIVTLPDINVEVPIEFFEKPSTSSGSSTDSGTTTDTITSEIIVENVIVTDSTGERIDRITKDSPPFTVAIIFADYGLKEVDTDDLKSTEMEAFLAATGGFVSSKGTRGTIKTTISTSSDAPRFRAEFKDVTWDGTATIISAQVRYNIDGQSVKGELSAAVHQAKAQAEGEEGKIPPPTPYIIVNRYSYGDGQIEAGSGFKLDLSFKNTSNEIPLENIVMTITTPEDLSIATASNTYYIESLAAGASMNYTIDLEAKPNAQVGSQAVQVAFTYQYLLEKERKESKTTESIAIPVTQIDRFELDPITEVPSGLIGEAAYISVSFINRGKSTTYNISGMARSQGSEIIAPAEHYGNLEPGKSDSIDVTIIPQAQGELFGEIVIQYEDENTNQKEISVPFTMYVDAPYTPPPYYPDVDIGMTEPPEENKIPTIIFCSVGGILMAVPIALYLMKRVKAKGAEDFDEDV